MTVDCYHGAQAQWMQTTSGKSTSGKELSVSFSKSDVVSFVVGEQPSPADDFEVPVASDKGKFPSQAPSSVRLPMALPLCFETCSSQMNSRY